MKPYDLSFLLAVLSSSVCAALGSSSPENLKAFACGKKLEIKDYSPLPLPHAPKGSWSGRLIAGPSWEEGCLPDYAWRRAAIKKCGAKPTFYKVGARCGGKICDKFVEVVFTCDRPKKHLSPDPWTVDHAKEARYFMRRSEILDTLVEGAQEYDKATEGGTVGLGNFQSVYFSLGFSAVMMEIKKSLRELYPRVDKPKTQHLTFYVTQNAIMTNIHKSIYESNRVERNSDRRNPSSRPLRIFYIAWDFLMPKGQNSTRWEGLEKYDVDGYELKQLLDSAAAFPELKPEITRLFVENLKKHTVGFATENLGFLGEPRAHLKLLKMYEEIFTFGHFDRKYLSKSANRTSSLTILLYLIAFWSAVICF